jgi:predicted DCC family thiol-disulfide oxidoreductase YuxK
MNSNLKSKILFDGNCIICDAEISHYKRIAPELFELVDISSAEFKAGDFKLTKDAVDKNMHVFTPDGDLKIGVDAFAHIWSRIPRYATAAKLVQSPVVNSLAKFGYGVFTILRPYLPKSRSRSRIDVLICFSDDRKHRFSMRLFRRMKTSSLE